MGHTSAWWEKKQNFNAFQKAGRVESNQISGEMLFQRKGTAAEKEELMRSLNSQILSLGVYPDLALNLDVQI